MRKEGSIMKAEDKGHEAAFCFLLQLNQTPTRIQFEKIGIVKSKQAYKQRYKQDEFFLGWMSAYKESHTADCQCEECKQ